MMFKTCVSSFVDACNSACGKCRERKKLDQSYSVLLNQEVLLTQQVFFFMLYKTNQSEPQIKYEGTRCTI